MKVAILGAGPAGLAMAALAARQGHAARLWSPRGGGTRHVLGEVAAEGALEGRFPLRAAADAARAMDGAALVLLCLPGHALPAVLERTVPMMTGEPAVLLAPAGGLAALRLRALAQARGLRPRIGALPVPALAARRAGAAVHVAALWPRWWLAGLDPRDTAPLARLAGEAFGLAPDPLPDLLSAALADPLARLHAARLLGGAGQPARLLARLEAEAQALAAALRRPLPGLPTLAEGGALAEARPDPEAAAAGLAFLEAVGAAAGQPLPLTAAARRLLEAACGTEAAPPPPEAVEEALR
ncbi:hypothetical protein ACI6QG_14065 [Roseococcus sp. DSY-14]|uniref:hypothetical protein n=1 Tax=Roseococcus sp. DSY-14 TaxID=3369650 RepID=UPI00387B5259